tara:strand:- start:52 stop:156 length:105 start_codon:yes stop_codon:yes gene_type:complete
LGAGFSFVSMELNLGKWENTDETIEDIEETKERK